MSNRVIICNLCNATESKNWWKCCPIHTTEQGQDVVCEVCAKKCSLKEDEEPTVLWECNLCSLNLTGTNANEIFKRGETHLVNVHKVSKEYIGARRNDV